MRTKAEECELLREYVNKLKEQLEIERRTVASFKKFEDRGAKGPPPRPPTTQEGAPVSPSAITAPKRGHFCPRPEHLDIVCNLYMLLIVIDFLKEILLFQIVAVNSYKLIRIPILKPSKLLTEFIVSRDLQ